MHGVVQPQGMEKQAPGAYDVEAPPGPVLDVGADLLAQFVDGQERLSLGTLQVSNFDPRIVDDLFMIVHKVKEAAHVVIITHTNRKNSASGFRQQSEGIFCESPLFVSGGSFSHGVETVQLDPADIRSRNRHEIGATILEPVDPAGDRPLVSRGAVDHRCPNPNLVGLACSGMTGHRYDS